MPSAPTQRMTVVIGVTFQQDQEVLGTVSGTWAFTESSQHSELCES